MHRKRTLGGVLASCEWKDVWATLTLAVDIDATHLINQWIDKSAYNVGIFAEYRYLLTVLGSDDVIERRLDVIERHHRNYGTKLLFSI